MSMPRTITTAEELTIARIFKKKFALDNEAIETLTALSEAKDFFILANICARAMKDLDEIHIVNLVSQVLTKIHGSITIDKIPEFYEMLHVCLKQEEIDSLFLSHMDDFHGNAKEILKNCGVSPAVFLTAIENCKNFENVTSCFNNYMEQKDVPTDAKPLLKAFATRYAKENGAVNRNKLIDLLVTQIIPGNELAYGEILLWATDLQNKAVIKKLLAAKASLTTYYFPGGNSVFQTAVQQKTYDVIEWLTDAVIKAPTSENMESLAKGVAFSILKFTSSCTEVINAVFKILPSDKRDDFYKALRNALTPEQTDKALLDLVNYQQNTVQVLLTRGVSLDALVKTIEKSEKIETAAFYLQKFFDQYNAHDEKQENIPNRSIELNKAIESAISRSSKDRDWEPLMRVIANNVIPGKEHAELYGKVLANVYSHIPKETGIISTLLRAKPLLTCKSTLNHTPLLSAVLYNDDEILLTMLKDSSLSDIAQLVADVMRQPNEIRLNKRKFIEIIQTNYISNNFEEFYKELKIVLTQAEVNQAFLYHMNDDSPVVRNMLTNYSVSLDTQIEAIKSCKNIEMAEAHLFYFLEQKELSQDKMKNVITEVINRSEKEKNWRLAKLLAEKIIPGNELEYTRLLLSAAKANQKDLVKTLIANNIPMHSPASIVGSQHILHLLIEKKHVDILAEMLKNSLHIKNLAHGVAYVLTKTNNHLDVVTAVMKLFEGNQEALTEFANALQESLSIAEADRIFLMHKDDADRNVSNMLMNNHHVSTAALIDAFVTSVNMEAIPAYLEKVLEEKIDTTQFQRIMNRALELSIHSWKLVDMIASKKIELSGSQDIYGRALYEVVFMNPGDVIPLVKNLLAAKAFVDYQDKSLETALFVAVRKRNYEVAHLLIDAGANPNSKNNKGHSPYSYLFDLRDCYQAALLTGQPKRGELQKQTKSAFTYQLNSLYFEFKKRDEWLQEILEEHASLKEQKSDTPQMRPHFMEVVFKAIEEKEIEIVNILIKQNVLKLSMEELKKILTYQDKEGNTILHKIVSFASKHQNRKSYDDAFEFLKLCLTKGADPKQPNHKGQLPKHLAEETWAKGYDLSIFAEYLKRDTASRADLLRDINIDGEKSVQKSLDNKTKKSVIRALSGMTVDIEDMRNYHAGIIKSDHGRHLFYLFLDAYFNDSQKSLDKIKGIDFDKAFVPAGDKEKLKYMQEFVVNNYEKFKEAKRKYDLPVLTGFYIVMKELLSTAGEKPEKTRNKLTGLMESIMKDQLKMSDKEIEEEFYLKDQVALRILKTSAASLEHKVDESDTNHLRAAIHCDIPSALHMARYYSTTPIYRRTHVRKLFWNTIAAVFGLKQDFESFKSQVEHPIVKDVFMLPKQYEEILLIQKLCVYACKIGPGLIEKHGTLLPIRFMYTILEVARSNKTFTIEELNAMDERLKESVESSLKVEGAYTKEEATNIRITEESAARELSRSIPVDVEVMSSESTEYHIVASVLPVAQTVTSTPDSTAPLAIPVPFTARGDDLRKTVESAPPAYSPAQFASCPTLPVTTADEVEVRKPGIPTQQAMGPPVAFSETSSSTMSVLTALSPSAPVREMSDGEIQRNLARIAELKIKIAEQRRQAAELAQLALAESERSVAVSPTATPTTLRVESRDGSKNIHSSTMFADSGEAQGSPVNSNPAPATAPAPATDKKRLVVTMC